MLPTVRLEEPVETSGRTVEPCRQARPGPRNYAIGQKLVTSREAAVTAD